MDVTYGVTWHAEWEPYAVRVEEVEAANDIQRYVGSIVVPLQHCWGQVPSQSLSQVPSLHHSP